MTDELPVSKHHRESTHRLRSFADVEKKKGRSLEDIGDRLGCSGSHVGNLLRDGDGKMSKTLDLAVEALMARDGYIKPVIVVAVVPTLHWSTVKTLIQNLGGEVAQELNALLADTKYDALEREVVVYRIDGTHEQAVSVLVTTLGGEIKVSVR